MTQDSNYGSFFIRRFTAVFICIVFVLAAFPVNAAFAKNEDGSKTGKLILKDEKIHIYGPGYSKKIELQSIGDEGSEVGFTSDKPSIASVDSKGVVTAKRFGNCRVTVTNGKFKAVCKIVVANKRIAITFDDGPGKVTTPRLLKALDEYDVKCTFFIIGRNAIQNKAVLKDEYKKGHEIANHSMNHKYACLISGSAYRQQVYDCSRVIKSIIGVEPKLFRAPGGMYNSAVRALGMPLIDWAVDPWDWKYRDAGIVYRNVLRDTHDGDIVLLHDIHPTSVTAAIRLIPVFQSRGYECVTVSELLGGMHNGTIYKRRLKRTAEPIAEEALKELD